MSSAGLILFELGRKCAGGHQHTTLVNGRAAAAAVYPPLLCRAILRGADAQRRWAGQAVPSKVLAELAQLVETPDSGGD
eukprot:12041528-Alexandrium_andersonii.AAC.1